MDVDHLTDLHFQGRWGTVVDCIDLSNKELHRQICVCKVMTPGSLGDVVVGITQNVKYVGSIPSLGALFPMFTSVGQKDRAKS